MPPEDLKALIDEAEVVSFDVFDTLVRRRHYSPTDVFAAAGGARFRLKRIAAEWLARLRHRHQEDVSLEQIYAFLAADPAAEIEAERRTLYANAEARDIYDYARAHGKRIIAISDMYLPSSLIREMLDAAGYNEVERVYLSSEVGSTKGRGTLFRHVTADLGIAPEKIVHIGDHQLSDSTRAKEHGLRSHHLPSSRMRFEAADAIHPGVLRALRRSRKPSHSLLLGLLRDGLADWDGDYWYAFGFFVVGPAVNAFVDWVCRRFVEGKHDRAFFFSRDGYLPLEVLSIRHPELPGTYTFASRRLFLIAALETLDDRALAALTTSLPGTDAREYWSRLGITNPRVDELLDRHFKPGEKIWSIFDRQRLETFFREAHGYFLPDVQREKKLLRDYLTRIGLLGGRSPLIVDVGWNASSQRHLESAFPELKGTAGAYFGLRAGAYRNGNMRAFFFDRGEPSGMYRIAMECVEITELMFSAPHPTVQKIDDELNAVFEAMTPEEERRIQLVLRIHEGALDFTKRLAELEASGHPLQLTRDDVALLFGRVVLEPTPADIANLGRLPHALGLGTSRYETLLPETIASNPLTILRQHLLKPRKHLYWPSAAARAVYNEKGPLRGVAARAAIELSSAVIKTWDRILRKLGK